MYIASWQDWIQGFILRLFNENKLETFLGSDANYSFHSLNNYSSINQIQKQKKRRKNHNHFGKSAKNP